MPGLPEPRRTERGQILPIFAGGLIALLVGVGLVVDGGNALAQQRGSQNAADAAAEAGTTVIAQYLMGGSSATGAVGTCPTSSGNAWDLEICKSVYGSAAANSVDVASAQYTDYKGDAIGQVGAGAFPAGAQGVKVVADRTFDVYFARVVGINSFNASTQATAVTGVISQLCLPGSVCGLFPITVPFVTSTCDNNGTLTPGVGPWPYLGNEDTGTGNEAIVPLCKDKNNDIGGGSAGSVGWLDYSTAIGVKTTGTCPKSFKDAILDPCVAGIAFPTWIQTFAGGVGKGGPVIQTAINEYHDDTVQIPLFDGTCKNKPGGTNLSDCPPGDIGVGINTWYHIPTFASFKVDYIYINGNDRKQCDQPPGNPYVNGNGANGCLKGWWVVALPAPGAIDLGAVTPSTSNKLGVQLIR
jgi:hypothetical protein